MAWRERRSTKVRRRGRHHDSGGATDQGGVTRAGRRGLSRHTPCSCRGQSLCRPRCSGVGSGKAVVTWHFGRLRMRRYSSRKRTTAARHPRVDVAGHGDTASRAGRRGRAGGTKIARLGMGCAGRGRDAPLVPRRGRDASEASDADTARDGRGGAGGRMHLGRLRRWRALGGGQGCGVRRRSGRERRLRARRRSLAATESPLEGGEAPASSFGVRSTRRVAKRSVCQSR